MGFWSGDQQLASGQEGLALPGAHPTNEISIEFVIRPKFAVLWFEMYSTNHNEMMHTSQQCNCHDLCKISLWSVKYILNYSTPNFGQISNSTKISLVGWAPALIASGLHLQRECHWHRTCEHWKFTTTITLTHWGRDKMAHLQSQCCCLVIIMVSHYTIMHTLWMKAALPLAKSERKKVYFHWLKWMLHSHWLKLFVSID